MYGISHHYDESCLLTGNLPSGRNYCFAVWTTAITDGQWQKSIAPPEIISMGDLPRIATEARGGHGSQIYLTF